MQFKIETERETDGRWIAEIPEIPGALAYGNTESEAKTNVSALASRIIAGEKELHSYQDELVRKGLEDVRRGRLVSHEDVIRRIRKKAAS